MWLWWRLWIGRSFFESGVSLRWQFWTSCTLEEASISNAVKLHALIWYLHKSSWFYHMTENKLAFLLVTVKSMSTSCWPNPSLCMVQRDGLGHSTFVWWQSNKKEKKRLDRALCRRKAHIACLVQVCLVQGVSYLSVGGFERYTPGFDILLHCANWNSK